MRTDADRGARRCACGAARQPRALLAAALLAAVLAHGAAADAAEESAAAGEAAKFGADWQSWHANTNVTDMPSVQRGARNFVSYCLGCHGLKYQRWSRLGTDLSIPTDLLQKDLMPPGDRITDYILTTMPAKDAETWFGKTPPDLSLMVRARGRNYIYQYLRTFYVDPTRQTGANNLRLPSTAMPHVLSELEGLKKAVYRDVVSKGEGGQLSHERVFDHFETLAPG